VPVRLAVIDEEGVDDLLPDFVTEREGEVVTDGDGVAGTTYSQHTLSEVEEVVPATSPVLPRTFAHRLLYEPEVDGSLLAHNDAPLFVK
jgi:hypothetical protein